MILVFLILLFILKFNSSSVYLDYLTGLLLLLCAVSAVFTLWVRRSLHLEVDLHSDYAYEGEPIGLTLRVIAPELCGKLRAAVTLRNLHRGSVAAEKHILSGRRCELSLSGQESGTIELTVPYVEVFGAFGLLRVKRRDIYSARINVYPCAGLSPDRHLRLNYVRGAGELQNAKGDDYSEIYELRPIQEGDDLRHVHRQLSAKYDEYIIKVGSDSRRPVYTYYIEDGLDFQELSERVAEMETLRESLDKEEGALMAAVYGGRLYELNVSGQLHGLADRIYEDSLPENPRGGKAT